mgnify:CR=1 FL=1
MSAKVKTAAELDAMREGGKILATIFEDLKKRIVPGMTGLEVNDWVEKEIYAAGARPTYKDANIGFPGVICISVNDAVVHGIPTDRKFEQGDIVGFDMVITYKGMKTDSAFTIVVGEEPTGEVKRLLDTTERSLYAGVDSIKPGKRIGDISSAIEKVLLQGSLGVVRELVGHGIGHEMHEDPEVPNYGTPGSGMVLEPGLALAIEPMATLGDYRVVIDPDRWTIRTMDGSMAAHFEHTVLITENGAEILTKL